MKNKGLSSESVEMIEHHLETMELLYGKTLGDIENNHERYSEAEFRKHEELFKQFLTQKRLIEGLLLTEPDQYEPADRF